MLIILIIFIPEDPLEEGVPSLDDLFKFKEEIQKIREEEFEKWLPNI
jgi:hypothetical protein